MFMPVPTIAPVPVHTSEYGKVSLAMGLATAVLGFLLFSDESFIGYFVFLAWFGSLVLFLRGWVCLSIGHEASFWSFHPLSKKYAK